MIGAYETLRDNVPYVDCWQTTNDTCAPHFHSSIELTYVLSGRLSGWVNGEEYTLGPNEILLCPCYSLHRYETQRACESIVLTVPMETIPSFQKLMRTGSFTRLCAALPADNELLHCLRRLIASPTENVLLRKGYAYAVMGMLTGLLELRPVQSTADTDFARDILLYLEDSYLQPLTVEQAAAHFGYSRGHFSGIFSRTFGFTFSEYLNILRCRRAAMLLTNSASSLIETAMNCGFGSMRTFYRCFKRAYGMTPTQYLHAQRPDSASGAPPSAVP